MSRDRGSTAAASSRYRDAASMVPPTAQSYEPLEYPLNAQNKINLQQITVLNEFTELERLLKEAATTLNECVLEINEIAAHRKAKSSQNLDQSGEEFMKTVEDTSAQVEKSVRATIDEMREVQNLREALKAAAEVHVRGGQNRFIQARTTQNSGTIRIEDDEDEDEDEDMDITQAGEAAEETTGPGPGPKPIFDEALKAERQKYELISMHNRYAEMPQYIDFKRHEWDGKHAHLGDEEAPDLPNARLWFTDRGSPAPGVAPDADDSDDDIQTLKVKLSTKCPLTLMEMKVPTCNRKCQHVYEEEAIKQHIKAVTRPSGRGQPVAVGADCPVSGCNKIIAYSDLYFDKLITRKIERVRAAREQEGSSTARNRSRAQEIDDDDGFDVVEDEEDGEDGEEDDDEEEEGDTEMADVSTSTIAAKREPRSSRY